MRTYTPKQIAEEMFAEVVMQQTEFVLASEAQAEVKRLSAEIDAMRFEKNNVISTWRGRAGRAEIKKDKLSIERAKLLAEAERLRAELGRIAGIKTYS